MLLQEARVDFIVYCFPTLKASILQNLNYFGYMLCMSIVAILGLFLYENDSKKKILYLLLFTFETYILLINDTFGCFVACVFSIPMSYLYYYKKGNSINVKHLLPLFVFATISIMFPCFFLSTS